MWGCDSGVYILRMDVGTMILILGFGFLIWPVVDLMSDGTKKDNAIWFVLVAIATIGLGALLAFGG